MKNKTVSPDFDVIICGAGPAGCTAAFALGSSGLRVALIDKERFPREKVCGDALPAYVPKVLKTIDARYEADFLDLAGKTEADRCSFTAPNGKHLSLTFSEKGYICKRVIFDEFLFRLASELPDVTVFQETVVTGVEINDRYVQITTGNNLSFTSSLLIGCDGAGSVIRKGLSGGNAQGNRSSVAVRAYFRNIKGITPGTLEFYYIKDLLPGYFWIFPLTGNLFNAGLGIPLETVTAKRINLRNEFRKIIKSDSIPGLRFSGAEMVDDIRGNVLPLLTRKSKISGSRFMLCGDAASLVNPATGAGIGQAMQSGRYAGWHAIKCFEKNDFSEKFMRQYDRIVYEKIWKENHRYLMVRDLIIKSEKRLNFVVGISSGNDFIKTRIISQFLQIL